MESRPVAVATSQDAALSYETRRESQAISARQANKSGEKRISHISQHQQQHQLYNGRFEMNKMRKRIVELLVL